MKKTVKIILSDKISSVDLARQLDERIDEINRRGIKLDMETHLTEEFDPEKVNELSKRGVTRLPAMIDGNRVVVGANNIVDALLTKVRADEASAPLGNNDVDISDFWRRELYSHDKKTGSFVPRKDSDEDTGDEIKDIDKRMRDYEKKVPKHRRTGEGRRRRKTPEPEDDNVDDAPDEDVEDRRHREEYNISSSEDAIGDDMDSSMLKAWLNNNVSGAVE